MTKSNFYYLFFFILIYFFLFFFENPFILGRWDSNVIYYNQRPAHGPLLFAIQKAADTVGTFNTGYILLNISKIFSKLFVTNVFTLKITNIIYGLLSLYLFFKIILKDSDIYTAYLGVGLYLTSFYFQALHLSLIAQPITVFLVLFCIFSFQNLNFENYKSYLYVILSSSLLLMNYIIGRYLFLVIITYFALNYFVDNKKQILNRYKLFKETFFKFIVLFFLIFIFLIIINPNNYLTIFTFEIFDPTHTRGERINLVQSNLFDKIKYNLAYMYENFILGINNINSYYLNYSVPYPVTHKYLLFFFFVGFVFSIKDRNTYLYYFAFITVFILCLLSFNNFNAIGVADNRPLFSSLSGYRLYMILPFLIFFISKGIIYIIDYLNQFFKKKIINKNIVIIIFILFGFCLNIQEKINFKKNIEKLHFSKASSVEENKPVFNSHPEGIFYHLYMKNLANKISEKIKTDIPIQFDKTKKNNLTFLFVDEKNYSFNFETPPGVEPYYHKYMTPVFLNLYLNQMDKNVYEFLILDTDFQKSKITHLIEKYKKYVLDIKTIYPKYFVSKSSYLFNSTHVILIDEKQYEYALNKYPNNTYKLDLKFDFLNINHD